MICERAAVYRKEEIAPQSSRDLNTFYRANRDAGNSRYAKSTAWIEIDAVRDYVGRTYPAEMLTPYDVESNVLFIGCAILRWYAGNPTILYRVLFEPMKGKMMKNRLNDGVLAGIFIGIA